MTIKRLIALALTLTLVIALGATAFATDITITEPEGVVSATYAGYQLLTVTSPDADGTDSGNGSGNGVNPAHYAYTVNPKYAAILIAEVNANKATGAEDLELEDDGSVSRATNAAIIDYISALDAGGMRTFADNIFARIAATNAGSGSTGISADATLATGANTGLADGYWMIAQTSEAASGETQSLVMVDTAGKQSITLHSKKEIVTVDKVVRDDDMNEELLICKLGSGSGSGDHVHTAACFDWAKTNDSPIGAIDEFKITTKIPADAAKYVGDYLFIINDTMSQGLAFVEDSVVVTIGGEAAVEDEDYSVRTNVTASYGTPDDKNPKAYDLAVSIIDPKTNAGKEVVVTYKVMVTADAVLLPAGNANTAKVTYSNKPNDTWDGKDEDGSGFPAEDFSDVTGETPESKTMTYATGIEFIKIDGDTDEPLSGAEFLIEGTTEPTQLVWKTEYVKVAEGKEGTGAFYLLKDGTYTDEAPVAEHMVEFPRGERYEGGYVVAEADFDGDTKTVDGVVYRVSTEKDWDAKLDMYRLVNGNTDLYKETEPNYNFVEHFGTQGKTSAFSVTVKADENGKVYLPGLAAGTYTITETKAPEGYNPIKEPMELVITVALPDEDDFIAGTDTEAEFTVKLDGTSITETETVKSKDADGNDTEQEIWQLFKLTIENFTGTELPSTGGIGTTIFYIAGSIMLIGAGILLVTKKRMGTQE